MAFKYIKVPYPTEREHFAPLIKALSDNAFKYAIESDYKFISVDIGMDTDNMGEQQLRDICKPFKVLPFVYAVDRQIREEHFTNG
jgi:hypothetical protein